MSSYFINIVFVVNDSDPSIALHINGLVVVTHHSNYDTCITTSLSDRVGVLGLSIALH